MMTRLRLTFLRLQFILPSHQKASNLFLGWLFDENLLAMNVMVLSRERRHHECVIRKNQECETRCNYQAFIESTDRTGLPAWWKRHFFLTTAPCNGLVNCKKKTCWLRAERYKKCFTWTIFTWRISTGCQWPNALNLTHSRGRECFRKRVLANTRKYDVLD